MLKLIHSVMLWNASIRRVFHAHSLAIRKPRVYRGLAIGASGLLLSGGFVTCCSCESETGPGPLNGNRDGTIQKALRWVHDKYDDHIVHSSLLRFGRAAYAVSVI